MPVPLRTTYQKAEAKYNVTTEFPSLGLHSAAATGNVGLVEYALDHGQPVNSVLDGVLPLHAACAGGNVQVVKVLIDHGADVNAPRLPRKYSNDRNRDASTPIVGTSGSTPLHFAAANGNSAVVNLLLLHGAHADRPDKHGVTPEMLAQQNGWVECAQLLNDWILNKDRDLKERKELDLRIVPSSSSAANHDQYQPPESTSRRRLHVKQSIDTALNMLKSPDSVKASHSLHTSTPPASPNRPFGDYTFYPTYESSTTPIDPAERRPSLPHILQPPSPDISRSRRPPQNSTPTTTKQRRPRSAGTGAEHNQDEVMHPVYGRGGSGRKLGSKYSLLNIFKKAQQGDASESVSNFADPASLRDNTSALSGSGSTTTLPLAITPSHSKQSVDAEELSGTPSSVTSNCRTGFRFHRGSDASTKGYRSNLSNQQTSQPPSLAHKQSGNLQTPSRTSAPLAVELHLALTQRNRSTTSSTGPEEDDKVKSSPLMRLKQSAFNNRPRSGSSGSTLPFEAYPEESSPQPTVPADVESEKPFPSPRPGILRAHNRTASHGQSTSPLPSRTLRFDSSSSVSPADRKNRPGESPRSPPGPLRQFNSSSSLTKLRGLTATTPQESSTSHVVEDEDEEDNYGQPLEPEPGVGVPSLLLQRQRGASFASSSQSSLSPILTGDNSNGQVEAGINADFPFSINRAVDAEHDADIIEANHLMPPSSDNRNRGDSLSSQSTSDSRNLGQMSSSSTSGPSIATPGPDITSLTLPRDELKPPPPLQVELKSFDNGYAQDTAIAPSNVPSRHIPSPLDIDLSAISSHAQAEALVERTRREVLDLAGVQELSPITEDGRSPLSARLAAYGETLALERKLREKEGSTRNRPARHHAVSQSVSPEYPMPPILSAPPSRSREGVERQLSLENKAGSPRARRKVKDPLRPSTAEGLSSRESSTSFFTDRQTPQFSPRSASTTHQLSTSLLDGNSSHISEPTFEDTTPLSLLVAQQSSPLVGPRQTTEDDLTSRNTPFDGGDVDMDTDSLPILDHISAASPSAIKGKREQVRSAKKLTRMGYPVIDQARAQPSPTPSNANKRFGLKSIMQSLKGKP